MNSEIHKAGDFEIHMYPGPALDVLEVFVQQGCLFSIEAGIFGHKFLTYVLHSSCMCS